MRYARLAGLLLALFAAGVAVGDDTAKTDPKTDYAEFSKLIQSVVVKQVPKVVEDASGWGQTVPIPDKLRLPGLRTRIKVGDKFELPHGFWKKIRVWMTDPAKDLQIRVREFKAVNPEKYKLVLDADTLLRTEIEAQHWQKGLALVGFTGNADVEVTVTLECDVAVSLITKKFPPELKVEPKVSDLKMDLKVFTLRQVTMKRLGQVLEGDRAKEVGDQFKGVIHDLLRKAEPTVKAKANEAIARSIQDGKGTFSATELMKALTPKEKN